MFEINLILPAFHSSSPPFLFDFGFIEIDVIFFVNCPSPGVFKLVFELNSDIPPKHNPNKKQLKQNTTQTNHNSNKTQHKQNNSNKPQHKQTTTQTKHNSNKTQLKQNNSGHITVKFLLIPSCTSEMISEYGPASFQCSMSYPYGRPLQYQYLTHSGL